MNAILSKYRLEAVVILLALIVLAAGFAVTRPRSEQPAAPQAALAPQAAVAPQPAGKTLIAGGTAYSLDVITVGNTPATVASQPTVVLSAPAGQPIRLVGWAVDSASTNAAGGISAQVDQGPDIVGTYGGDRPDVAAALKNDRYRKSAYVIDIPSSDLSPGVHLISLKVLNTGQSGYYLVKNKIKLTVQ